MATVYNMYQVLQEETPSDSGTYESTPDLMTPAERNELRREKERKKQKPKKPRPVATPVEGFQEVRRRRTREKKEPQQQQQQQNRNRNRSNKRGGRGRGGNRSEGGGRRSNNWNGNRGQNRGGKNQRKRSKTRKDQRQPSRGREKDRQSGTGGSIVSQPKKGGAGLNNWGDDESIIEQFTNVDPSTIEPQITGWDHVSVDVTTEDPREVEIEDEERSESSEYLPEAVSEESGEEKEVVLPRKGIKHYEKLQEERRAELESTLQKYNVEFEPRTVEADLSEFERDDPNADIDDWLELAGDKNKKGRRKKNKQQRNYVPIDQVLNVEFEDKGRNRNDRGNRGGKRRGPRGPDAKYEVRGRFPPLGANF